MDWVYSNRKTTVHGNCKGHSAFEFTIVSITLSPACLEAFITIFIFSEVPRHVVTQFKVQKRAVEAITYSHVP